jgi:site-specific recombinase XerD
MVHRRASDARIEAAVGCHTFLATGIRDYLTSGGRVEAAQRMVGHSTVKTTGIYDRRKSETSLDEHARGGGHGFAQYI